jgi:hypothetical protein
MGPRKAETSRSVATRGQMRAFTTNAKRLPRRLPQTYKLTYISIYSCNLNKIDVYINL